VTDLCAARIAAARGDHDTRDRRLLDAATAAVSKGFCHIFSAEAPELLPVLRTLAESRRQLLPLVLSLDMLQAATPGGLPYDQVLSRRELSVLHYLPSNLTNPEIAAQLGIATNTLKTHVRTLYRKLDVRSRTAAIRVARTAGLL
jgi:DNA-binding NarL/FixJ family response regulator